MDKEYVLVKIGDKDYLLSSPQKIPQDVRNALMDLVITFNQLIIDGEIDQIEKELYMYLLHSCNSQQSIFSSFVLSPV